MSPLPSPLPKSCVPGMTLHQNWVCLMCVGYYLCLRKYVFMCLCAHTHALAILQLPVFTHQCTVFILVLQGAEIYLTLRNHLNLPPFPYSFLSGPVSPDSSALPTLIEFQRAPSSLFFPCLWGPALTKSDSQDWGVLPVPGASGLLSRGRVEDPLWHRCLP